MKAVIKDGKFNGTFYNDKDVDNRVKKFFIDNNLTFANVDETPDIKEYSHLRLSTYIDPTEEQLKEAEINRMTMHIDILLDKTAIQYRYDNITNARAMAGVPLSGNETEAELLMHNEAVSLAVWERSVWAKSTEILTDVEQGAREILTQEELLSKLPKFEG